MSNPLEYFSIHIKFRDKTTGEKVDYATFNGFMTWYIYPLYMCRSILTSDWEKMLDGLYLMQGNMSDNLLMAYTFNGHCFNRTVEEIKQVIEHTKNDNVVLEYE